MLLVVGCGSSAGDAGGEGSSGVAIVASTNVYGDIARSVAGPDARITSIVADPSADPHTYEATTRNVLAVARADIVIENGGGYDDFMGTLSRAAGNDSAHVLDVVAISGRQAAAGEDLNEHVWYDFATITRLVDHLRAALVAVDPARASIYRRNAADLTARLHALQVDAARIGARHRDAPVAVTEPLPLYLVEAIGLHDRTPRAFTQAVEEGQDAPPAVLAEVLDLVTTGGIDVLLENAQTLSAQTTRVADAARAHHVPVVSLSETLPEHETYVSWMQANLDALGDALDRRRPGGGA